jgi:hypothetical protein
MIVILNELSRACALENSIKGARDGGTLIVAVVREIRSHEDEF